MIARSPVVSRTDDHAGLPVGRGGAEPRLRDHASCTVFARYPNVATGLVGPRTRRGKRPRGDSLKLLTSVAKNKLRQAA